MEVSMEQMFVVSSSPPPPPPSLHSFPWQNVGNIGTYLLVKYKILSVALTMVSGMDENQVISHRK